MQNTMVNLLTLVLLLLNLLVIHTCIVLTETVGGSCKAESDVTDSTDSSSDETLKYSTNHDDAHQVSDKEKNIETDE